ncbi:hypothetical protein ACQPZF_24305 [Actinosynnema sp. CS-041913]|uniref:hypothetical protein n=1 Tax=Actinosynnema sp. CS-041913 TaxID=3239917 RepID=UPI003D8EABB1
MLTTFAVTCAAEFDVGLVPAAVTRQLDAYRVLWPQKWTFFTRLGEDAVVGYRIADDGRLTRAHERRDWTGNAGGLGRTGEARRTELRRVALRVPDRHWQPCGRLVDGRCAEAVDLALVYRADNPFPRAEFCGTVVVALERVTPSVRGHLPEPPRHTHLIAVTDLRCTG